jgi:hypothetical protein
MEEDSQSSESFVRPVILSIVMLFVVLLTPAYIHFGGRIEISAVTWLLRIEQDEPLRFFLTLDPMFFVNAFMKYLFVIMIFRFYSNQTTLKRTLLFGLLIEIYIFVALNSGNLLYTIFPQPGFHPSPPGDFPLPISLLIFLILALLIPQSRYMKDTPTDEWLDQSDEE